MENLKNMALILALLAGGVTVNQVAAVSVQFPAEPWVCDPVKSCSAQGTIILSADALEGMGWGSTFDDRYHDDTQPVTLSVSVNYLFYMPGYSLGCWNITGIPIAKTRKELAVLTNKGKDKSLSEVYEALYGKRDLLVTVSGCSNLKDLYAQGYLYTPDKASLKAVLWVGAPSASTFKLPVDVSPLAPPPAFDTCEAMVVTNMNITGVAREDSEGTAFIKPLCPAGMMDLKFSAGNAGFTSNEVPVTFTDGRSETLSLTIDGQPANNPVIRSPHAGPIEIRGTLPATGTGSGTGSAWVRVEYP